MKILLFPADSRCFQYLLPVAKELQNSNHRYFFMATNSTQLIYPIKENLEQFQIFTNEPSEDMRNPIS